MSGAWAACGRHVGGTGSERVVFCFVPPFSFGREPHGDSAGTRPKSRVPDNPTPSQHCWHHARFAVPDEDVAPVGAIPRLQGHRPKTISAGGASEPPACLRSVSGKQRRLVRPQPRPQRPVRDLRRSGSVLVPTRLLPAYAASVGQPGPTWHALRPTRGQPRRDLGEVRPGLSCAANPRATSRKFRWPGCRPKLQTPPRSRPRPGHSNSF